MGLLFAAATFMYCFTGLPAARQKAALLDISGLDAKVQGFDVEQEGNGTAPMQDAFASRQGFAFWLDGAIWRQQAPDAGGAAHKLVQQVQYIAQVGESYWLSSAVVTAVICLGCYIVLSRYLASNNLEPAKRNRLGQAAPQNSTHTVLMAVGVYVVTEVARTLITFHSLHSPEGSSHMTYEPTAVVLLAEVIKLIVAACCVFIQEGVIAWQDSMQVFWPQCSVAALFTLQNTLNLYAIVFVGPTLFALFSQCKIVFTCLFMALILGKKFSKCQQTAVFILIIAVGLPEFGDRSKALSKDSHGSYGIQFLVGLLLLVIAGVCSGLSAVMSEKILKDETRNASFMLKNAMLYMWGLGFNLVAMVCKPNSRWFKGFGAEAFIITLLLAGTGLSVAWILKYMDNVVRCFASISTVFLTAICSVLLFGDALDFWMVIGEGVFCCAITLYMYKPGEDYQALKYQALFSVFMISVIIYLWSSQSASDAR